MYRIHSILSEHYCSIIGPYINQTIQKLMITTSIWYDDYILVADIWVIVDYRLSFHCSGHHTDWIMNVLENGTDVNAWNNIRYLFMMYTIINGFLILVLAFTSASFSSRFKYYYDNLDVNLIRCSADVKAKNSIRNLIDVIGQCDWTEERILCC